MQVKSAKVTLADNLLKETLCHEAINKLADTQVQSCSSYHDKIVPAQFHALMNAAEIAFDTHRPLVLTPDIIWLTIAQGIAQYINLKPEELRSRFVKHAGKEIIRIQRNDFVWGSPENLWAEVFGQFSDAIKGYIGNENHGMFVCDFSTSGPIDRAASEIVLMEAMKSYFDYRVQTMCGIPYVDVQGTADDWAKIAERVKQAKSFLPEWWTLALDGICEEFINASQGNINEDHWKDIYNEGGGSGGPYINGWLVNLIPFTKDYRTEKYTVPNNSFKRHGWGGSGITSDKLPSSLCKTEFIWEYWVAPTPRDIPMHFIAGLAGIEQNHDTLALKPYVGWAVTQRDKAAPAGSL